MSLVGTRPPTLDIILYISLFIGDVYNIGGLDILDLIDRITKRKFNRILNIFR